MHTPTSPLSHAADHWASRAFYRFDDLPATELPGGILRKEVTLGRVMLVWFRLPGGLLTDPEHCHPHEQVSYIVSGELEATIGGKTRLCRPGGGYLVAPNVKHHIRVLSDCECIDAFAPPREDYL
ncbi:cupin domain-containing protein [bacterium]|nr:cupin domain-containing protein [bacterium]